MEIRQWYARDKNGDVYLYPTKPYKHGNFWIAERMSFMYIPDNKLPEGINPQWEDEEPVELKVIIEPIKKHD